MTSSDVGTGISISTPAPLPAERLPSKPRRVTGKLKVAMDAMVERGIAMDEAAREAGLTTRNIRLALERAHVLAYLKHRKQVFRASISAANISVLAELRDKSGNAMARLGAIKVLEAIDDERPVNAQQSAPGVVIVIGTPAASVTTHERGIEAKPLISNASASRHDVDTSET